MAGQEARPSAVSPETAMAAILEEAGGVMPEGRVPADVARLTVHTLHAVAAQCRGRRSVYALTKRQLHHGLGAVLRTIMRAGKPEPGSAHDQINRLILGGESSARFIFRAAEHPELEIVGA